MDFFFKRIVEVHYDRLCAVHNIHPTRPIVWCPSLTIFVKQWLNNPFVNGKVFFSLLYIFMRTRYTLRRFFVKAIKKKQRSCNGEDMSMTPFSDYPEKLLFTFRENGKKYTFLLSDLLNIVKQSLTSNIDLHPAPRSVMNPYTRSVFRKETLYLFFIQVHQSRYVMPPLFYSYVKNDFDLKAFFQQNECMLREHAIKTTVDSINPMVARSEIRDLLKQTKVYDVETHQYNPIVQNAEMIPANVLLQFKPWLYAYYVYNYSLNPAYKNKTYRKLVNNMIQFVFENPEFGKIKNHIVQTLTKRPIPPFRHEILTF